MHNNITIRKGNLGDLQGVHALVGELAAYENEADAFTATLEEYKRDFGRGDFECLVAVNNDKEIIGMTIHYLTFSTWKGRMLYLEDFIVKEKWRKYGVGQQLFDALFMRAEELECILVKWQVLDWNEPAINFYKKNNATIERNWWSVKKYLNTK